MICSKCKEEKSIDAFYKNVSVARGYSYNCKSCEKLIKQQWRTNNKDKVRATEKAYMETDRGKMIRKKHQLYRRYSKYGLTESVFNQMLVEQNNCCYLCLRSFEENIGIAIDHDHNCCSGKTSCGKCVRKLLCSFCNSGLGFFREDIVAMKNAIEYLENHKLVDRC